MLYTPCHAELVSASSAIKIPKQVRNDTLIQRNNKNVYTITPSIFIICFASNPSFENPNTFFPKSFTDAPI